MQCRRWRNASHWHSSDRQHSADGHAQKTELGGCRGTGSLLPSGEVLSWPLPLQKRWLADGGNLTVDAVSSLPPAERARFIDLIGATLPSKELKPLMVTGGLLGASVRGDTASFVRVAEALFEHDWVLAELGAPESLWPLAVNEGKRLWPRMQPGRLSSRDGSFVEGISPSGATRGDRYISVSAAAREGEWEALQLIDTALALVGTELSERLAELIGRRLKTRTDPFFACFPPGSRYGAHFDGGGGTGRLTMILYTNCAWRSEDGGALELLDEPSCCWRSVTPIADRLLIFRSDDVLHRVAPVKRQRFALTTWWSFADDSADGAPDERQTQLRYSKGADAKRLLARMTMPSQLEAK